MDANAAADVTDTAIKTGGSGILGAALILAAQWARDRLGAGPGSDRAKDAKERDVEKLQKDMDSANKEIGEIRTALALAARDSDANKDRMSRLEGAFAALSSTVQLTMNSVQSELSRIAGYMQAQSEQRHDRRWLDPTPPPRRSGEPTP